MQNEWAVVSDELQKSRGFSERHVGSHSRATGTVGSTMLNTCLNTLHPRKAILLSLPGMDLGGGREEGCS